MTINTDIPGCRIDKWVTIVNCYATLIPQLPSQASSMNYSLEVAEGPFQLMCEFPRLGDQAPRNDAMPIVLPYER